MYKNTFIKPPKEKNTLTKTYSKNHQKHFRIKVIHNILEQHTHESFAQLKTLDND